MRGTRLERATGSQVWANPVGTRSDDPDPHDLGPVMGERLFRLLRGRPCAIVLRRARQFEVVFARGMGGAWHAGASWQTACRDGADPELVPIGKRGRVQGFVVLGADPLQRELDPVRRRLVEALAERLFHASGPPPPPPLRPGRRVQPASPRCERASGVHFPGRKRTGSPRN